MLSIPEGLEVVCKIKQTSQHTTSPKAEGDRDWEHRHLECLLFYTSIWMFQFCHMCLRGILPWASSSSFFCSSSGISGPLHHRSCHPRHASWEPFLHCILPWLLSPTAVWVSQLSPHLPVAPASSAVHCAKCEVIKTQKTPPLSWEEDWKAHICQKRQRPANFACSESASRVCQLLCAYNIGSGMWLAWQESSVVWEKEKFVCILMIFFSATKHWSTSELNPG